MPRTHPRLLAISRPHVSPGELERWALDLAAHGVRWFDVRVFDWTDRDLLVALRTLRGGLPREVRLTVAARPDLCLLAGFDGVQLPARGLKVTTARRIAGEGTIVGRSTHSVAEVRRAAAEGADYVLFGPVDPPLSKSGTRPATGLEQLAEACQVGVPVFALGGVTISRLAVLGATGAAGAAGISMFDPGASVDRLIEHAASAFTSPPDAEPHPTQEPGGRS